MWYNVVLGLARCRFSSGKTDSRVIMLLHGITRTRDAKSYYAMLRPKYDLNLLKRVLLCW